MPRPVDPTTAYVPALDGVRAIAVLAVVGYHLHAGWAPGGLLGVAVFFTLSGYLITANLLRSRYRTGGWGLPGFWFRRFRRLVPAVVVTVATVVLVEVLTGPGDLGARFGEALSSLLYVNNWHVIAAEGSYFDQFAGPGPLDHMWSLSIEEQFYLVWPLVLAGMAAAAAPLGPRGRRWAALAGTGILAAASFAWMAHLAAAGADATRIYEGTDTRAGGLLAGAALAIALVRPEGVRTPPPRVAGPLAGAGVLVLLGLIAGLPDHSPVLFRGGLVAVSAATMAAVAGALHRGGGVSRLLGCAPLRWLGERSYGIYLWHLPVTVHLPAALGGPAHGLAVLALSTALAAASWALVEDPIRRHGVVGPLRARREARRAARATGAEPPAAPRPMLAAAAVSLAGVVVLGVPPALHGADGARAGAPDPAMSVPERPLAEAAPAEGPVRTSCDTVVHVGDSTSIGMFADAQLPAPEDNAALRYVEAGADEVVTSVFGARATAEGWRGYPSAVASVAELKAGGLGGQGVCWVIATGVNDAANEAVGHGYPFADRIAAMLEVIDGDRVLWATATTARDYGPWDVANMAPFNRALRAARDGHPNLVIYDWAADARPGWFLDGDLVHYNPTGNAERAARFAEAVALAWPAGGRTPRDREVDTAGRGIRIPSREAAEEAAAAED